jgi:hypothetical protein
VVLDSDVVRVVFNGALNGTVVVDFQGEFDAVSFPLLIAFIKEKLHVREGQIKPTRIQWNTDIQGLTLEGANCLTIKGIHGDLIRLYNRGHPSLRREVQSIKAPSTVAEVEVLLQGGGLPSCHILQGLGLLVSQVKQLFEQHRASTELSVRTTPSLEELAKGLLKRLDTLDRLEERLIRRSGS